MNASIIYITILQRYLNYHLIMNVYVRLPCFFEAACNASSIVSRFSADFNCTISGGVGNGKFTTLSIFIAFICSNKSSTDFL